MDQVRSHPNLIKNHSFILDPNSTKVSSSLTQIKFKHMYIIIHILQQINCKFEVS